MEYQVKIHKKDKIYESKVEAGTNLLKFLRKNDMELSTPCGGHGTCGKCRVKVTGLPDIKSEKERKLLGAKAIEKGYRLACFNIIKSDIEIFPDSSNDGAKIMTEANSRKIKHNPIIKKEFVTLNIPGIEDQKSDYERVVIAAGGHKVISTLEFLKDLPEILRKEDFKVTLGFMDKKLLFVESGDTTSKLYGVAVDIGTTTVAAYLYDLNSGERKDVFSQLNPQKIFGADVLSRIDHCINSSEGLNEVNFEIMESLNGILAYFANNNQINVSDIYSVVFVGNTTMLHFLLKISPKHIAFAPFIPITTELQKVNGKEIGLNINKFGVAIVFPSVSAYIGADTIGAVLSSGMYDNKKISLLIDIGTNGEIALGNNEWLVACSTAAGPAFEGANIRNGVGGIQGAIDKVVLAPEIKFSTIGNAPPIGLCGSGIVDTIAQMLETGIIDETGRIDKENDQINEALKERITTVDGMNAFMLSGSGESESGTDIAITQKDIRELQNAKAAIAAGIKVLAKYGGIELAQIDRVFLAGGFGSYINIESALRIGLIPIELKGKIESIGNAAGAGAIEGLVSSKMLKKAVDLKNKINYVELSSRPDFVAEYVECMMFD